MSVSDSSGNCVGKDLALGKHLLSANSSECDKFLGKVSEWHQFPLGLRRVHIKRESTAAIIPSNPYVFYTSHTSTQHYPVGLFYMVIFHVFLLATKTKTPLELEVFLRQSIHSYFRYHVKIRT